MADFIQSILPTTGKAGITDVTITLTGKHTGREQRTATRTITFEGTTGTKNKVMTIVQAGAPVSFTPLNNITDITVESGQNIVLEGYGNGDTLRFSSTDDRDYIGTQVKVELIEDVTNATTTRTITLTEVEGSNNEEFEGVVNNITLGKTNRYKFKITFLRVNTTTSGSMEIDLPDFVYFAHFIPSLAGADITESGATSTVNFTADETEKTVKVGAKKGFSIPEGMTEHPSV